MKGRPEKKRRRSGGSRSGRQTKAMEALPAAIKLHQSGGFAEAEKAYQRILGGQPDQPDALHFLGVLRHQTGESEEALELIGRAIALRPTHPDMHNNLGNVLREMDRLDEAAAAYGAAITIAPDLSCAHHNLGVVLRRQHKVERAIASYDRAIALRPDHADTHYVRGNALRELGRFEEAVVAYGRALGLNPDHRRAYTNLGNVFYRLGRTDDAYAVFRQWAERDPGNEVALHMMAACSGRDVPIRASDGYVERVFDDFADNYDENLRDLEYRVPEWIGAVLPEYAGEREGQLVVLDAGCGTGLCGSALRPYSRRLTGVDLSSAMLERARKLGAYDDLVRAELTAFMAERDATYDLIVSADTFVYFGALEPVLAAAARALRAGGFLIFTVEQAGGDGPDGYRLGAHGRYSHSKGYLEGVVAGAGMDLRSLRSDFLRKEGGQAVGGWLVVARRMAP